MEANVQSHVGRERLSDEVVGDRSPGGGALSEPRIRQFPEKVARDKKTTPKEVVFE
jgi:hypothetical protein